MCIYTHTYAPIDDLLAHMQLSVVVSIDLPTYRSHYLSIDPSTRLHIQVFICPYTCRLSACGLDVSMGPSMLFASQPCISPSIDLPMELVSSLQVRLYVCSSIG